MKGAHFMVRPTVVTSLTSPRVFDTREKAVEFIEQVNRSRDLLEIVEVCAHCHRAMYADSIAFFPPRNEYRCSQCRWENVVGLVKEDERLEGHFAPWVDVSAQQRTEAAERAADEAVLAFDCAPPATQRKMLEEINDYDAKTFHGPRITKAKP